MRVRVAGMGPVARKEVMRPRGVECAAGEQGSQAVDARPVVDFFDEPVFDRVGRDVDELAQYVSRIDEVDDADLLGGPEVFPASAKGVLGLGEELVEVLGEGREVAVGIKDEDGMLAAMKDEDAIFRVRRHRRDGAKLPPPRRH